MEKSSKITSFTQLETWKEGHRLTLVVYKITREFPKEELYALGDQMRRAAISVTSNVAEGFSRASKKEKTQFYSVARGSLTELQNQLLVARDVRYITEEQFSQIADQTIKVSRLLTGLKRSAK